MGRGKAKVNRKLAKELQWARATQDTAWEEEVLRRFSRKQKSHEEEPDSMNAEGDVGVKAEGDSDIDAAVRTEPDEDSTAGEGASNTAAESTSTESAPSRRRQVIERLALENVPEFTKEQIQHKAKLRKRKEKRREIQKKNEDRKRAQKKGKGKKTRRDAGIKQEQNWKEAPERGSVR